MKPEPPGSALPPDQDEDELEVNANAEERVAVNANCDETGADQSFPPLSSYKV